ncbi:MAG: hypothetical protein K0R57_73 [Paenibacillaceae bacterium]|nr:hypothetical protein [Paenibacillaceae bacterium]
MNSVSVSNGIQIVEYNHSYATAIAHMWNQSSASWGGGAENRTAESIIQDMNNSINLHNFLAVDGDQVVGFCSFSHYMMDEGALYVPLLNVRPDYHNKKIGKALILNAVAKTIEMGWSRLDLFTWSGNTKAVPMYKKCGFFWEKKDDGVHLMNYIPTVLQTEALQPYFDHMDWYGDSTRAIEIKPDGQLQNGKFDIFAYSWKKDGQELRVEFEKTGRGIHTLDTPDYEIRTEVAAHDLVFGKAYPVRYHIRSKTGQPVVCEITGLDDKNICFSLSRTITVTGTAVVEGEFKVEPVQEEQSDWKTHPVVLSQWRINGRRAELRTGIAPKFPARVNMAAQELEQYVGTQETLYLNIENQFQEAAEFRLELPEADFIKFEQPEAAVLVPAAGKASVAVSYRLSAFGVYSPTVTVHARTESGESIAFEREISFVFRGLTGRFSGEDHKFGYAAIGPNMLVLNKQNNELRLRRTHLGGGFFWSYPRLGKPYSSEFAKKKAECIRFDQDSDAQIIEALYESEDFPGVAFKSVSRIHGSGLIEHYYVIENHSGENMPDAMHLLECFRFEPNRMVLPYDGEFLDLHEAHANHMEHWEPRRVSENWLFSRGEKLSFGFTWDASQTLVKTDWLMGLEHPFGGLPESQSIRTKSTYLAAGTFADWRDFRSYALKKREARVPALSDHLELRANGGNPFTADGYCVEVLNRKTNPVAARLSLSAQDGVLADAEPAEHDHMISLRAERPASEPGTTDRITLEYDGPDVKLGRSTAVFALSRQSVRTELLMGESGSTLRIANGMLTLTASPAFGSAAHSLIYNGREWLDTSYPAPGPRSWWNPWLGGLGLDIPGMSPFSLQQETRSGDFASLSDNKSNVWSGIRLTVKVEQHEANRGLTVDQYYLLLPGAPVLAKVNRITNRTGISHPLFKLTDRNFFLPGAALATGWMEVPGGIRYRLATNEDEIAVRGHLRFGSNSHPDIVHIAYDEAVGGGFAYTNNLLFTQGMSQGIPLPDGACEWTKPVFYIFGQQPFQPNELAALHHIRFDHDVNKED